MDYKNKIIKKKIKQFGGGITKIPEKFFHVMSITKAVIGILYHNHKKEYPRDKILYKNITIGNALNMNSRLKDNKWNFEEFMNNLDNNENLLEYSKNKLNSVEEINRFSYNNLIYQLLASNLDNAADKLGEFMNETVKKNMKEYYYFKEYRGFFKEGKGWKWHHTKNGEPTGPNGFWMTKDFALKFAKKVKYIVMKESINERQKVPSYDKFKFIHNKDNVLKKYWNGWWYSNKCAYAIGNRFQYIAFTPNGIKLQLYHEPKSEEEACESYKKGGKLCDKLKFITNIEKSIENIKLIPKNEYKKRLEENAIEFIKQRKKEIVLSIQ
jgi:hypothetical protein